MKNLILSLGPIKNTTNQLHNLNYKLIIFVGDNNTYDDDNGDDDGDEDDDKKKELTR